MFPLEWVDRLLATKSEGVWLIVRAVSFQDFQPKWSQITNVTDRQTDRQTDRRHAIPRPRICTKVHCAVKMKQQTTYSSVTLHCGLMWRNRLRRLCRSSSATIAVMPWNCMSDTWTGKASSIMSMLNLGLSMLLSGKAERFRDILACAPTGSKM